MDVTTFRVDLVRTVDESYPVVVGRRLDERIAQFLERHRDRRIAVVTDSTVESLAVPALAAALGDRAFDVFAFPAGEASKTRAVKERLEDAMIARGFGRDSVVVALGGGVVTDLAGFLAATFTRGVPYVSAPTTLLAAADAAVGGKTAVDTPAATNLIGAFHQPSAVFVDLDRWLTLSDRHIREGLGETVKHACLADAAFFDALEDAFVRRGLTPAQFVRDDALAELTARRNCEIKRDFVTSDVHEGNRRMGLNLGHTIGRALETAARYTLNHGECVAIGLALQSRLGERLGYCSPSDVARIEALLSAIGLPTKIPEEVPVDRIMEAMAHDKKGKAGAIRFVFQDGVGRLVVHDGGSYARPVAAEDVRAFLQSQV